MYYKATKAEVESGMPVPILACLSPSPPFLGFDVEGRKGRVRAESAPKMLSCGFLQFHNDSEIVTLMHSHRAALFPSRNSAWNKSRGERDPRQTPVALAFRLALSTREKVKGGGTGRPAAAAEETRACAPHPLLPLRR